MSWRRRDSLGLPRSVLAGLLTEISGYGYCWKQCRRDCAVATSNYGWAPDARLGKSRATTGTSNYRARPTIIRPERDSILRPPAHYQRYNHSLRPDNRMYYAYGAPEAPAYLLVYRRLGAKSTSIGRPSGASSKCLRPPRPRLVVHSRANEGGDHHRYIRLRRSRAYGARL